MSLSNFDILLQKKLDYGNMTFLSGQVLPYLTNLKFQKTVGYFIRFTHEKAACKVGRKAA